jgi:hypothetical protein
MGTEATDMEVMATAVVVMATMVTEAMATVMGTADMDTGMGMDTAIGTMGIGTMATGMATDAGGAAIGMDTELVPAGGGRPTDMSGCATEARRLNRPARVA